MPRFVPVPLLLSLTVLLPSVPGARAQESGADQAAAPAAATSATDSDTTTTTLAKSRHSRTMSDGLASALSQTMPKYNPPPPPKPEEATDEPVDLRDVDKPRNKIIRLPKYVVQEPKPPVFRERDLYSAKNRTDLSYARNPGLKFTPFPSLNRAVAAAMYQEQERLDNIADLKDTARTVSVADKEDGAYIKRLTDETYIRSGGDDFGGLSDAWSGIRSK